MRGVQSDVAELFQGYSWPGNIRELRNVLERAIIVCDRDLIGRVHLPDDFGRGRGAGSSDLSYLRFPPGATVDAVERELILQTLASTSNKTRAAELLGISLKTLHNKLKEYEAAKNHGGEGRAHIMRLLLKTKITIFIALLVLGVVGVSSWLYLRQITRQVIQQAEETAHW